MLTNTHDTASQLIWRAFGSRAPEGKTGGKYVFEAATGSCATCAAPLTSGVPFEPRRGIAGIAGIDNDTFSGHSEYARWGTHVCKACAWLYGDPKRMHRSVLVVGGRGWWPTIAQTIEGRPRWRYILGEVARSAPSTPMTGVLTTDPKPRLWPRTCIATCGVPGLYVHIPEQDISRWAPIDITRLACALRAVDAAVQAGATKTATLRGLFGAPKLVDALGLDMIDRLERELSPMRGTIEFNIAAVIA